MPVAHLGHAELRVTDLDKSTKFFTEVMGLSVTEASGGRVYLRAWQDWDHHTLVLTQADRPGVEHVGWRVKSPEALTAAEKRLKDLGTDFYWTKEGDEAGQGAGLRFHSPSGIPMELYWDVEKFAVTDPDMKSPLPSHPQRYTGWGISPRRFDHVNFLVNDVATEQAWLTEEMDIRHRYFLESDGGDRLGSWLSRTCISHEIALMRNRNQSGTLLHHVAYYLDSPDEVVRAATILSEAGLKIEWGPGRHGTSGAIFLYFFEPSGNRIEVWTGGFLIFAPDWQPIRWDSKAAMHGLEMWGSTMPETYLTYGTEPAAATQRTRSS